MDLFLHLEMWILILGIFLCFYRIAVGPTAPDRSVGIEVVGIIFVGFCAFLSMLTGEAFYMTVAIAWALLSFIGSLALGKYLEGSEFDE